MSRKTFGKQGDAEMLCKRSGLVHRGIRDGSSSTAARADNRNGPSARQDISRRLAEHPTGHRIGPSNFTKVPPGKFQDALFGTDAAARLKQFRGV